MIHRRLFVGTGWKMNKTVAEAVQYLTHLQAILPAWRETGDIQAFIIPPFTAIETVKRMSPPQVWVGAQNMHWAEAGAYTGEISAPMLRELGVDLVEIGHAERRRDFGEVDALVNLKVLMALRYGMRPLICVGEQSDDVRWGVQEETVARQLKIAVHGVAPDSANRLLIAYEPTWAIGDRGTPASPEQIKPVMAVIREILAQVFGARAADSIPVLYGGTVNPGNTRSILNVGGADGLFVGRCAWQPEGFADVIRACLGVMADWRNEQGVGAE
jgi:triosephosphate isomerase